MCINFGLTYLLIAPIVAGLFLVSAAFASENPDPGDIGAAILIALFAGFLWPATSLIGVVLLAWFMARNW